MPFAGFVLLSFTAVVLDYSFTPRPLSVDASPSDRPGPSHSLRTWSLFCTVVNVTLRVVFCFGSRHVRDYILYFTVLTCFLSVRLLPLKTFQTLLSQRSPCLSPHLQVLKPLSEHYMEDNVRQTVVNSIRASLTEQASQHTKLKRHWSSSSLFITLPPTRSMWSLVELWN